MTNSIKLNLEVNWIFKLKCRVLCIKAVIALCLQSVEVFLIFVDQLY